MDTQPGEACGLSWGSQITPSSLFCALSPRVVICFVRALGGSFSYLSSLVTIPTAKRRYKPWDINAPPRLRHPRRASTPPLVPGDFVHARHSPGPEMMYLVNSSYWQGPHLKPVSFWFCGLHSFGSTTGHRRRFPFMLENCSQAMPGKSLWCRTIRCSAGHYHTYTDDFRRFRRGQPGR